MSVLVIVPTHSNSGTLQNALESIRVQTHSELDVQVIADGANIECIRIAKKFSDTDNRFSLQIHPKSERRGEEYRHQTIVKSKSSYVTYLADDDLFLPDHVEYMLSEIQGYDFVNQRPTFINRADEVWCMPTDISIDTIRKWHLDLPMKNSISLSGVMHTKNAYDLLKEGWMPSPENIWTDLYMWRKFLENPDFDLKTTLRCTVLKFLGESNVYNPEKIEQHIRWSLYMKGKDWLKHWDLVVELSHQKEAARIFSENYSMKVELEKTYLGYNEQIIKLQNDVLIQRNRAENVLNSKTWRATKPVRSILEKFRERQNSVRKHFESD